jgi:chromosome segregation ATPase
MSTPLPPEPQKKSCLERAIVFFIRLLFAFIVGVAIGVGIYFGARLLYSEYQSLTQDYESRIAALESNQAEADQTVSDRLSGYQTRLETLEIQGDTQKETLTELAGRLDSHDEFRSYHATLVMGQQLTLQNMQDLIPEMQVEISTVQSDLETLQGDLTGIEDDIQAMADDTEEYFNGLEENQAAIDAMNEMVLATEARMTALEHKMVMLQGMELLTRARLNLVQGNATLAQSDIEAARDLLTGLQAELPTNQAAYVGEVVTVLDETLSYLPGAPLTASDLLETAWQMLAAGLPDEAAADTDAEASPASDEDSTPEPTTQGDATATPTPTPPTTPTPTP